METDDNTAVEEEKEIDLDLTREILDQLPQKSRRYLIPTLQKVQAVYRYLPETALVLLQKEMGITRAQICGVISFYPQFFMTEPGKYILKLCYGTACFVKGAAIIAEKIHDRYHIHPGETDEDKLFTLQTASCLGNCGAAPMAIIGEDTYGNIDPENTLKILGSYKISEEETEAPAENVAE